MSINFKVTTADVLSDVKILTPSIFEETRGNIWTSYCSKEVDKLLPSGLTFNHDKFSRSKYNVLRGIHWDNKSWKLVTCVHGEISQVVVDMRETSITYKKFQRFVINEDSQMLILIPPGFGNAYCVSSKTAVYHYKLAYEGDYIDADDQFTAAWNDPELKIDWPTNNPILSKRDAGVT